MPKTWSVVSGGVSKRTWFAWSGRVTARASWAGLRTLGSDDS